MKPVHSVILGDCREVLPALQPDSISACITDPPYNYEFTGHKWNASEIKRRTDRVKSRNSSTLVKNIPYGSGLAGGVRNARWYERNRQNILDYSEWCRQWGEQVFRVLKPGGVVALFNSARSAAHVQVALEDVGFYMRDCIVYRRHSGIPKGLNLSARLKRENYSDHEEWQGWHSCLRNEWEAIVVLQKPLNKNYLTTFKEHGTGLFYTGNADGSFQSNIIENIPKSPADRNGVHCAVKPLKLMEKLVTMFAPPGKDHIVLDPFAGSGTTLLAAKRLGRSYIGIEIEAEYVETINRRLDIPCHPDSACAQQESKELAQATEPAGILPLFQ